VSAARLEALAVSLTADELGRAHRMLPLPGRRAVASRGILRELLGSELGLPPAEVMLRVGEHGKPYVDGPLAFSVAHSDDVAVFAFADGQAVGVDIERIRALDDGEALAAEVLGEAERNALATLPPESRDAAFLEAWTRKEAYLKGRGDGLTVSPQAVTVSVLPGEAPALLGVRGEPDEPGRWSLHRLDAGPDHVGTLAIETP
jgi:4'-phosphopantetheinyl transferase